MLKLKFRTATSFSNILIHLNLWPLTTTERMIFTHTDTNIPLSKQVAEADRLEALNTVGRRFFSG
jgi:hypothetical protein